MIKIFHNKNFLDYYTNKNINKSSLEKVAEVETDSLDEAFRITQNIDDSWTNNQVITKLDECRSTSVGDVLLHDDKYYVVEMLGFSEIDFNK